MNLFKRIYLYLLYHQRKYDRILELTNFKLTKDLSNIDDLELRYQANCSLFKKNFYHSRMCLELLQEKGTANAEDYNQLAFIHSRHNEKEKTISAYCKALEINRGNSRAKKALDYIRKQSGEINFSEDEYFEKILKKQPLYLPVSLSLKIIIVAILVLAVAFFSYKGVGVLVKKIGTAKSKTELDKILLPDYNPNLLDKPKEDSVEFSYSEKEIKEIFEKTKKDIIDNRAVEAQVLINRIKLSNASASVKAKMEILEGYIPRPDYAFFKNEISFGEFSEKQLLYENVYVLWNGRVVNKSVSKEDIRFFLVIGDEVAGVVDGMVPVVFEKAVLIENNDKIGVFGKIKFDDKRKFYLEGKFAIKEKK